MRIGFDAKRIFYNFRGLGNYSRTLVESLYKFHPEHQYILFSPPLKDIRGKEWSKKYPKLEIITPKKILSAAFPTMWRSLLLSNTLKESELDIYHGLSHELPPNISKLSCKKIVTIHDLIFMRYPEFFPWIDRQVYLRKFRYACEVADVVIAICEQTKKDIIKYFGTPESKIRVVYQSCAAHFYTGPSKEQVQKIKDENEIKTDYILFVGALEERKNALTLAKAYCRIAKNTKHDLVLVGNGKKEYQEQIRRVFIEHGLSNRLHILNDISFEQLPLIYAGASIFCYPSFFEGFGIPIIEALFSGVPVITSKGSCFPEAGGPDTIYIDPNNLEELLAAIENLLTDKELRQTMARNGRLFVEKFHWKNTALELTNLYQDVISQKSKID